MLNYNSYDEKCHVGQFVVKDGAVLVGDPGYEDFSSMVELKVKPGLYDVYVSKESNRNSALIIEHTKTFVSCSDYECANESFTVDCDLAGVFNKDTFLDPLSVSDLPKCSFLDDTNSDYYKAVVELVNQSDYAGAFDCGAASFSGYGDGVYNIYTASSNNEIKAVILAFIEKDTSYNCCHKCGCELDNSYDDYCDDCYNIVNGCEDEE